MKNKPKVTAIIYVMLLTTNLSFTQNENVFGKPNENAPKEIKDFQQLIGLCDCKSVQYKSGVAGDTLALKWRWKYILNGNAVQDDGWFDGQHNQKSFTSIRILNPKTKQWQVPFFVPYMTSEPQIWKGGKNGENIVLRKPEPKQNGEDFESVLTFSNISNKGFNWTGKKVNLNSKKETVFWKIWCIKEL
ncbi:hypothetical protein [Psychroserpens algicola]|uniref:Uncharacterized protein n=1 Tax=Psychroserpens algicola TaxID=1719034 RepID=A0ABT0HA35_9FLAO|nr:hypothetical protein [Psychroserpens algicola]MCK8481231.1 hypothetical protein [Psychroserpens algicola]